MKLVKLFLLVVVVFCSFSHEKILTIDLPSHTPKQTAQMSKLFRKVKYIPLETTDECLLSYIHVQKIQDYILAWDYNSCCLFSAKDGKFIRKIGHKGDDPEAVYSFYENFHNPYDGLLYFLGVNGVWVKYSLDGKYAGKMKVPLSADVSPQIIRPLDSKTFFSFFANRSGREKKRIVLFDYNGNIIKEYPNHHFVETKKYILDTNDGLIYKYKDNLYFKEMFIDTVYQVSNNPLKAKYMLNITSRSVPYKERYDRHREAISPIFIYENDANIAFDYYMSERYQLCIYNKQTKESSYYLCEKGLVDDINGFMPVRISTTCDDGTCLGVLNAEEICDYIEKNEVSPNSNLSFIKSISPDDNPVVVFMEN
ncbi:6-bladed beta-propeller [Parabacteroides faecis]|uniref:DUF4934 domain-containing protein n=1 Tax=Parabacteroides faecis TaxID=1217282 RepID=A0ABR6KTG4_9BACT|nr:6-bladed beta-propeller [Parabacteroides faecis]MBB4624797.1 hypothetical protein [Parabacteroides faecis]